MNPIKKIMLFFLFCLSANLLAAQNATNTEKVFDKLGKQKGSVLVKLGTDVLGKNTRMQLYKSLIISSSEETTDAVLEAIRTDIEGGTKLLESQKDGKVTTGYYCLKRDDDSSPYEYILFKEKSKKINLIYIRGHFRPESLDSELDKLKDLLIYVNNKRIKLQ